MFTIVAPGISLLYVYMYRYCKGISEAEEKELKQFAEKRKIESLGKGVVVKHMPNGEIKQCKEESVMAQDLKSNQGNDGHGNSTLPITRNAGLASTTCNEV